MRHFKHHHGATDVDRALARDMLSTHRALGTAIPFLQWSARNTFDRDYSSPCKAGWLWAWSRLDVATSRPSAN